MQHKQASLLKTISIYKIIHDWYGVKYTSYFCAAQFLIAHKGTTARTWWKGQNWRRKGGNGAALFSAKYTEQRRASGRITLVTLWLNTSTTMRWRWINTNVEGERHCKTWNAAQSHFFVQWYYWIKSCAWLPVHLFKSAEKLTNIIRDNFKNIWMGLRFLLFRIPHLK